MVFLLLRLIFLGSRVMMKAKKSANFTGQGCLPGILAFSRFVSCTVQGYFGKLLLKGGRKHGSKKKSAVS